MTQFMNNERAREHSVEKKLYEQSYRDKHHFSFGKNWQIFLRTLNSEKIEEAEKSLVDFLGGRKSIEGKTFVDVGCGSGLFSLAAYRLGASQVLSVDIDEFSLACAKHLRKQELSPNNWAIQKGSALDKEFLGSLGTFDIVYSWGVLHHTGDMYRALENTASLATENSLLYIALYNESQHFLEGTSKFWVRAKMVYNKSNTLLKKIFEGVYTSYYVAGLLAHFKNPIRYIKNYQSLRGMNFYTDIKDWLGGYPYEYSTPEQIINFFLERNFEHEKTVKARSLGCNEFLFRKKIHRNQ